MDCNYVRESLVILFSRIFRYSSIDEDMIEYVDFIDDYGMDSIDFITVIIEIEAFFKVTISDDMLVMDNFRSIDIATNTIIRSMESVPESEEAV